MIKYKNLQTRFLKYVKENTRSNPNSTSIPSDPKEIEFIKNLKQELDDLGLENTRIMKSSGYLFAELPANCDIDVVDLGFIAHVDTADFNSENINPQIVENYDGKSKINLDKNGQYVLDPKIFPSLNKYGDQTLITTDGSTLLGADDKAGVSEIITAMEYLIQNPEIKHGKIVVGFGPDEEIGTGADHFEVDQFDADFAYTVDGGPLGDLQYETFNAAEMIVEIKGTNVHPAEAKGIMVNASQLAIDFHSQLPIEKRPEKTAGREGFYFLESAQMNTDKATMNYIIRDHDKNKFEDMKEYAIKLAKKMNEKYDEDKIILKIKDQYYNMAEVIKKDMRVVDLPENAMKDLDIEPNIFPVRGGTDGSKISFLGLPTPNLFAGPENMHGRFEYISLNTMSKAVDVIIKMTQIAPRKGNE
ncbi:peptidase T [Lactobacillus sp. S2-2]|uniref:peptidase T n=1 Tax=Lactobacillus sp. S2-2 TaxID=2692917 RepID=UPI001F011933|nr:peptidase T [Lactobacillus sp. S2-2]MCF6514994.1 peptidase T [Lactobacillus sp. S2-2]